VNIWRTCRPCEGAVSCRQVAALPDVHSEPLTSWSLRPRCPAPPTQRSQRLSKPSRHKELGAQSASCCWMPTPHTVEYWFKCPRDEIKLKWNCFETVLKQFWICLVSVPFRCVTSLASRHHWHGIVGVKMLQDLLWTNPGFKSHPLRCRVRPWSSGSCTRFTVSPSSTAVSYWVAPKRKTLSEVSLMLI